MTPPRERAPTMTPPGERAPTIGCEPEHRET